MSEYTALEAQIEELEKQLAAKKVDVNQIAEVIGKPLVEGDRPLTAQILEPGQIPSTPSSAAIARAITGRALGR